MASGPADKALDTFKELVFDQLVKVAIQQIIGMAAFLAWGPVAFIVAKVVTFVADTLYDQLQKTINFQYIMLQNEQFHKAYVDAVENIKEVAKKKGINSPEFRRARDGHKVALSKFVRWTGT